MKAGAAEIDITPDAGIELTGYAARVQPSVGVRDRLAARGLWLESGRERLLWLHADVLGFDLRFADAVRREAAAALSVEPRQVVLSATHTHAGPGTMMLRGCGRADAGYVDRLRRALLRVATEAAKAPEPATLWTAAGECAIGRDRRGPSPASHVDPTVAVLALRRSDGTYLAVAADHAVHPVALTSANRSISADFPGVAAARVRSAVEGEPVVMMITGACANVNPVRVSDDGSACEELGAALGATVATLIGDASSCDDGTVAGAEARLSLPLETLTPREVREKLDSYLAGAAGPDVSAWAMALRQWHDETLAALERSEAETHVICPLHGFRIGGRRWLGVGAEVFSRLGPDLRRASGLDARVAGYTDGLLGYVCPRDVCAEGGYEPDVSARFFGRFAVAAGGHEAVLERGTGLLRAL